MAGGILYLDIDDEITSAAARIRSAEGRRVAVVLPYGSRVATSRINFRLLSRDALTHEKRLSIVAADAATRALAASAGLPVFASVAEYEASEEAPRPPRDGGGTATGLAAAGLAGETARVATSSSSVRGRKPRSAPPPEQATLDEMEAAELAAAAAAIGAPTPPGSTPLSPSEPSPASQPEPAAGEAETPPRSRKGSRGAPPAASTSEAEARSNDDVAAPAFVAATTSAGIVAAAGPTAAGLAPSGPAASGQAMPEYAGAAPSVRTSSSVAPGSAPALGSSAVTTRPARARPRPASSGRGGRTAVAIGLAIVALVLLVGGVGAYIWLPSASIVVTPKEESVGPVLMTIAADPTATAPDALADPPVVPAETVSVDVTTSGTFPATGKRVVKEKATGTVRFRNKDFTSSNTIPAGSVVSTANGIRFKTDASVTVPRADIVGLQVFPKTASVKVTAVTAGTEGNVEPNTIVVIPRGEDPISLDVNNPDATTGGKRDEFPKVTQADVDGAIATLNTQLDAAFVDQLKDPSIAAPGATVFPETRLLGASAPNVDPATLVGQEIESFDLGLTATGTATAVDEAPLQRVAEERLKAGIDAGHHLVADSVEVAVEPAVLAGGQISFPASASARQTAVLDPNELKRQIMGKPLDEARSILEAYGDVTLSAWPDWVSTVPTLDGRVDLTVSDAVAIEIGRAIRGCTDGEPVSRLLGVDLGERRVGIALADGDGAPARPLTTLRRASRRDADVEAIQALVRSHDVGELVVGLPLEASGDEGPQAQLTRTWADALAADLRLPVTFRDERLTSHLAEDRLGPMPRGRSGGPPTKAQRDAYRARVDREAAAIILQDELDARAGTPSSRTRPSDPSESRP